MRAERGGADKPTEVLLLGVGRTSRTSHPAPNTVSPPIDSVGSYCEWSQLPLTCSWGRYHCRSSPPPKSAGTAEQSDLSAVCWDPCDLLAWPPVTVATTDGVHQPTAPGTFLFLLNEPPCIPGPLGSATRWQELKTKTTTKQGVSLHLAATKVLNV